MNISITRINTFLDCPRKYWYQYELKMQTPKGAGLYFGSAIHEGLENYYSKKDPMEGVKNALFGKKDREGEKPQEGIDLYKLHKEARRVFDMYPSKAPHFEPTLVEHFFRVPLIHPETKETLPVMFIGKIDLITAKGEVVDHKTSSAMPNGFWQHKNELQASGYCYAYLQMFGKLPKAFIVNTIVKGNTKREPVLVQKIIKRTIGDICFFFDTCKQVTGAIIRKETRDYPNSSKWGCRFCSFKSICSYNKK